MPKIHPRSILITGCSSGIGKSAALILRGRGYRVFATARRDEDLQTLQHEKIHAIRLELSDHESVTSCVTEIKRQCNGKLDALFNNGAYGQGGALEDLSRRNLINQFEANFFGWHDLTQQILPLMRRQGHGRIILNSSLLGYVALPFRGAYIASKYALEGWADTLRIELAESNIQVILLEPGPIATRFRENSRRVFERTIQPLISAQSTVYANYYAKMHERLGSEEAPLPFTLSAEAVVAKLIKALETSHPKTRYRITFPAHLFWTLKKIFSDKMLDYLLVKVGR